jgi:hypothetical protein
VIAREQESGWTGSVCDMRVCVRDLVLLMHSASVNEGSLSTIHRSADRAHVEQTDRRVYRAAVCDDAGLGRGPRAGESRPHALLPALARRHRAAHVRRTLAMHTPNAQHPSLPHARQCAGARAGARVRALESHALALTHV